MIEILTVTVLVIIMIIIIARNTKSISDSNRNINRNSGYHRNSNRKITFIVIVIIVRVYSSSIYEKLLAGSSVFALLWGRALWPLIKFFARASQSKSLSPTYYLRKIFLEVRREEGYMLYKVNIPLFPDKEPVS